MRKVAAGAFVVKSLALLPYSLPRALPACQTADGSSCDCISVRQQLQLLQLLQLLLLPSLSSPLWEFFVLLLQLLLLLMLMLLLLLLLLLLLRFARQDVARHNMSCK